MLPAGAPAPAAPPAHALVPARCTGFQWDYVFDWTILKYQQSQTAARTPPLQSAGDATAGASASRDVRRGADDEHDRTLAGFRGAADPARRRCAGPSTW